MQEYAQKPEKSSSDSNSRSSGQPPISEILQAYKNGTLQRMSVGEEELLQAKTRDKSSERETLQRYTDTHGDKSRYNSFIQGMFDTSQRKGVGNEEPLQGKFDSSSAASESTVQREVKPNNTGLPDNLKSGIENLSGYSLDDVKVHYNSPKPAQLQALAYTQGTDIHVAPGQEKHLPHEAWHVVQQMQGRVKSTMQMQGIQINDNEGLEKEADIMGDEAQQSKGLMISTKRHIDDIVVIPEQVTQLQIKKATEDGTWIFDKYEISNTGFVGLQEHYLSYIPENRTIYNEDRIVLIQVVQSYIGNEIISVDKISNSRVNPNTGFKIDTLSESASPYFGSRLEDGVAYKLGGNAGTKDRPKIENAWRKDNPGIKISNKTLKEEDWPIGQTLITAAYTTNSKTFLGSIAYGWVKNSVTTKAVAIQFSYTTGGISEYFVSAIETWNAIYGNDNITAPKPVKVLEFPS